MNKLEIPEKTKEVRLFLVVRNEELRLPYLLDYYFTKGIDRIIVVDNCSDDLTKDILLRYNKVHLFETNDTYQNHWFWMEKLLDEYGHGNWCLVVDADEVFSYPHEDKLSIKELCKYMEKRDENALRCFLLDMYSERSVAKEIYTQGSNPFLRYCFFDKEYSVRTEKFLNNKSMKFFNFQVYSGGVRKRVFSIDLIWISKVPLFKYFKGMYLTQGVHALDNAKLSQLQGVLFHFKFMQDFTANVADENRRKSRVGFGADYIEYKRTIEENNDLGLHNNMSIKYRDWQQLVELGLMKTVKEFDDYISQV